MASIDLNKEQERSASHGNGPALTLSGAGTGKTRTLTGRFERLVDRGVKPENIFVVTFTVKAANEMKERIGSLLSDKKSLNSLYIGTFHSLCSRILRRFYRTVGLKKGFDILDPVKQKQIFFDLKIFTDTDEGDLVDIISKWKDAMITPEMAKTDRTVFKNSDVSLKMAEYYQKYEVEKKSRGSLDFSDLIWDVVIAFEKHPIIKKWFHSQFKYILVDEYQDINKVQLEFLKLAMNDQKNIWCVGDDDQSLYSWRGSDVKYSVRFKDIFPNASVYTLKENYRSTPIIVSAGNSVIQNNTFRVKKSLTPKKEISKNDFLFIKSFPSEKEEAEWIALRTKDLIDKGTSVKDICVLFRTTALTPSLQKAFEDKKIPFILRGAQNFWTLPEVKIFTNILKLIQEPDNIQYQKALGESKRGKDFRNHAEDLKKSSYEDVLDSTHMIVSINPAASMDAERIAQWHDSCDQIYQEAKKFKSFDDFFAFIEDQIKINLGEDRKKEGVILSTIHSAKGLEWKHVFICGCEKDIMPHIKSEDIEEERRLCYVAITRAMKSLIITYSKKRFGETQKPSPFLYELEEGMKDVLGKFVWYGREDQEKKKRESAIQKLEKKEIKIKSGDKEMKVYRRGMGKSLIPPDER